MKKWKNGDLWAPLISLGLLSLLFRFTDLDLRIEARFFQAETGWALADNEPWRALFLYGTIPALVVAIGGGLVFLLSFGQRQFRAWRRPALFLALLMVIGPGLLVNVVFKDGWGRPRPREVTAFGGPERFLPLWEKGVAGHGKSFPSGHAAMAFYFLAPWFFLRRTRRAWGRSFLGLGLGYGVLMGLARMVQGGHFPSDVLWSAGMVYLSAWGLARLLALEKHRADRPGQGP